MNYFIWWKKLEFYFDCDRETYEPCLFDLFDRFEGEIPINYLDQRAIFTTSN